MCKKLGKILKKKFFLEKSSLFLIENNLLYKNQLLRVIITKCFIAHYLHDMICNKVPYIMEAYQDSLASNIESPFKCFSLQKLCICDMDFGVLSRRRNSFKIMP